MAGLDAVLGIDLAVRACLWRLFLNFLDETRKAWYSRHGRRA